MSWPIEGVPYGDGLKYCLATPAELRIEKYLRGFPYVVETTKLNTLIRTGLTYDKKD
jgi:hypothetical protein